MDLPDHPRVREIEAERRLRPLGVNCAINILRDGSRHVIAFPFTDPNGPGTRQDDPYFSERPFLVTRTEGRPDVVTMKLLQSEAITDPTIIPPPPTEFTFGFALVGEWEVDGSPETGYPWIRDQGGSNAPGGDNWNPVGATGTTTVDPPTSGPFRRQPAAYEASYIFSPLLFDGTTTYELAALRCWIGTIDPLPDTRATPLPLGEWRIQVDEWTISETDPLPGTYSVTHDLGAFQMLGTEDPTDPATWPLLSPALVWALTTGSGVTTYQARMFKNLRITLVV